MFCIKDKCNTKLKSNDYFFYYGYQKPKGIKSSNSLRYLAGSDELKVLEIEIF